LLTRRQQTRKDTILKTHVHPFSQHTKRNTTQLATFSTTTSFSQQTRRYPSDLLLCYLLSTVPTNSPQKQTVKRFYLNRHPWVSYKIIDKTVATEYSLYLEEEKDEKRTQHQREKRRAKKKAIQRAKGTEIERQGALEAGGKDKRVGGKSYKKCEDVDVDAGAGAAEEQAEVGLEKLVIGQVKQQTTQRVATGNDKRVVKEEAKKKEEMQRDEEAKKEKIQRTEEVKKKAVWDMPWKKDSAVDEIRKPNWFFSGEDVLKEG
jgi:hypothetical protein